MEIIHEALQELKPQVQNYNSLKNEFDKLRMKFYCCASPSDVYYFAQQIQTFATKLKRETDSVLGTRKTDSVNVNRVSNIPRRLVQTNTNPKRANPSNDNNHGKYKKTKYEQDLLIEEQEEREFLVLIPKSNKGGEFIKYLNVKMYEYYKTIVDSNEDGFFENYEKNVVAIYSSNYLNAIYKIMEQFYSNQGSKGADDSKLIIEQKYANSLKLDDPGITSRQNYVFGPRTNGAISLYEGQAIGVYEYFYRKKYCDYSKLFLHDQKINIETIPGTNDLFRFLFPPPPSKNGVNFNNYKYYTDHGIKLKNEAVNIFRLSIRVSGIAHANVLTIDTRNDKVDILRYEPHGTMSHAYDFYDTVIGTTNLVEKLTGKKTTSYRVFGCENEFNTNPTYKNEYYPLKGYQSLELSRAQLDKWEIKYLDTSNNEPEEKFIRRAGCCFYWCLFFIETYVLKQYNVYDNVQYEFLQKVFDESPNDYFLIDVIESYKSYVLLMFEKNNSKSFHHFKQMAYARRRNLQIVYKNIL